MKSPEILIKKLKKSWANAKQRASLLSGESFPMTLSIGLPKSEQVGSAELKAHLLAWQRMDERQIGQVIWHDKKFAKLSAAIACPTQWHLDDMDQWCHAVDDALIDAEARQLLAIYQHPWVLKQSNHPAMSNQLAILVQHKDELMAMGVDEIIALLILVSVLQPKCADGLPMRALTVPILTQYAQLDDDASWYLQALSLDSKYFERHKTLITKLLDVRFAGAVSARGLAEFLGVSSQTGWVRLYETQTPPKWLNFRHLRVLAGELDAAVIPFDSVLIIENEQCLHLLPPLPNVLVILGAGNHLSWLAEQAWQSKKLYYWGDIDTWGLKILADAKLMQSHIRPVMMDWQTLHAHRHLAVTEPKSVIQPPIGLDADELYLFAYLGEHGLRLEQEFLSAEWVYQALNQIGLIG